MEAELVRGAEIWLPDGETLRLAKGAYRGAAEFARTSEQTRFRRGEGLPGSVWTNRRALLWKELGASFVRSEAAKGAGIDAALAVPWFRGRELMAIVTLLLGRAAAPGSVELWDHEATLEVFRLGGGYFAGCPELERVSTLVQFPSGAGLPGITGATSMPLLIPDVRAASRFVRARAAEVSGLKLGCAVPVLVDGTVQHVLALIASADAPFVLGFRAYTPVDEGSTPALRLLTSATGTVETRDAPLLDLALTVLRSGLPALVEVEAELTLALPIHRDDRVASVVVVTF